MQATQVSRIQQTSGYPPLPVRLFSVCKHMLTHKKWTWEQITAMHNLEWWEQRQSTRHAHRRSGATPDALRWGSHLHLLLRECAAPEAVAWNGSRRRVPMNTGFSIWRTLNFSCFHSLRATLYSFAEILDVWNNGDTFVWLQC